MVTRRTFLYSTLGAGLALATQGPQPVAAQPVQQRRRIIVDSQIHMWKLNTPDRPWAPGTRPQLPEPMTIERLVPMIDEWGRNRGRRFMRRQKSADFDRRSHPTPAQRPSPVRLGVVQSVHVLCSEKFPEVEH